MNSPVNLPAREYARLYLLAVKHAEAQLRHLNTLGIEITYAIEKSIEDAAYNALLEEAGHK